MAMVKKRNAKEGSRRNDPNSSKSSPQNQMGETPY